MKLRFRHLRLRAETGEGRFGADIPLSDGLMIFRADNSRGKSTAMQGFLFALGLERMITARPAHAVTSAMRDRLIFDPSSKRETPVISSWISLEISGNSGEVATLTRWVKHDEFDPGLVRVTFGPALTAPGDYEIRDFYVGRPGAAANPRGFHKWLSSFIGWELPQLPAADGRLAPLYMEQVFPLLFVEQRRGWGGIQAQMPYFSGVSDVKRRSLEFILKLDVGTIETERLKLRAEEKSLQDQWKTSVRAFKESITGDGLLAIRLPDSLVTAWPPNDEPVIAEGREAGWISLDSLLVELREQLRAIDERQVRTAGPVAGEMEGQLAASVEQADNLRQLSAILREELLQDQRELAQVQGKLEALQEDLREHQDILTLENLGSESIVRLHADCPVCHQDLPPSLLGAASASASLSTQASVDYIRQQIDLFLVMERDTESTINAKRERLAALRRMAAENRSRIRSIRSTLTSSDDTPSEEDIARKVRLNDRISALNLTAERFAQLQGEISRLADAARKVRSAIRNLPKERISDNDKSKIRYLQRSFIDQLGFYDFGSFQDDRLGISTDDYLPRRDDFDLQADISASDSIRVVWSYLLGLLETGESLDTNHPGILIFDEPRQQSAKQVSFEALLRRAAQNSSQRQVIFATSEDLSSLQGMLRGIDNTLVEVDGYLLKPVQD